MPATQKVSKFKVAAAAQYHVDITPGVGMYSVLGSLNYKLWYAIAEFVDNSLQSFLTSRMALKRADRTRVLRVDIEFDPADGGRLVIRDNAGGIAIEEFARAFRPAEAPPDRGGLSEFGMGMKSAACFMSRHWKVRTSVLGSPVEHTINFDVDRIVAKQIKVLDVNESASTAQSHFTELTLTKLNHLPHGRTVGKIREHLASMYRQFLRDGILELCFNGDPLRYEDPEILLAPHYKEENGKPKLWRVEFDIALDERHRVYGFAGIRAVGSTQTAGFALFRRNRLIVGSADEPYRPMALFGAANKFASQRIFGELHLEGFKVTHTKDAIVWGGLEEKLTQALKRILSDRNLPILQQVEHHRSRPKPTELKEAATTVVENTAQTIENGAGPVVQHQRDESDSPPTPPRELPNASTLAARREMVVDQNDVTWRIALEMTDDPAYGEWVEVSDQPGPPRASGSKRTRKIGIRFSLAHPFMVRFAGADPHVLEPIVRIGVGLILAEITAREGGSKYVSMVRINLNELLAKVLHKP